MSLIFKLLMSNLSGGLPGRRVLIRSVVFSHSNSATEILIFPRRRMLRTCWRSSFGGMLMVSPFTYFRGAPAVMAHDLATTPTTARRWFALRVSG